MTTKTEKIELRKKMLDACIKKQRSLTEDFKSRIQSLSEVTGLGNEESYDNIENAVNASKVSEINSLNELLQFANNEMELLYQMKLTQDVLRDRVVPGAVVVTNKNTFLVSASIEEFVVDGKKYFGISAQSPLFLAMKGKGKGDTFTFSGTTYKISDIF